MERIRVLQLVSGIAIGDQSGGAEQLAARLAIGLPNDRFERAIFAMWRYDSPAENIWLGKLAEAGVRMAGMIRPEGRLWIDLYRVARTLWSFTGEFRPHIINSHSERGDTLNALVHAFHRQHPLSVRTMGTDQQWQNRVWAGQLLTFGIFPLLFNCEVAIAEQIREVLDRPALARLLRKPAALCYNGIDEEVFDRTPEPAPDLPPGRPRVLTIGRLAHQKGYTDLIEAFVRIHDVAGAHLVIVGSGPLEVSLREQVRSLNLDAAVHFLGSRSDVAELLAAADLFVSSSLWEGFPTIVIEAMALRIPVVATNVSGSRELVRPGETGLLVPPGQPDALASAVIAQLADRAMAARMALAARQHARRFTSQGMVDAYAKIYETLGVHRLQK